MTGDVPAFCPPLVAFGACVPTYSVHSTQVSQRPRERLCSLPLFVLSTSPPYGVVQLPLSFPAAQSRSACHVMHLCRFPSPPAVASTARRERGGAHGYAMPMPCSDAANMHLSSRLARLQGLRSTSGKAIYAAANIRSTSCTPLGAFPTSHCVAQDSRAASQVAAAASC